MNLVAVDKRNVKWDNTTQPGHVTQDKPYPSKQKEAMLSNMKMTVLASKEPIVLFGLAVQRFRHVHLTTYQVFWPRQEVSQVI